VIPGQADRGAVARGGAKGQSRAVMTVRSQGLRFSGAMFGTGCKQCSRLGTLVRAKVRVNPCGGTSGQGWLIP